MFSRAACCLDLRRVSELRVFLSRVLSPVAEARTALFGRSSVFAVLSSAGVVARVRSRRHGPLPDFPTISYLGEFYLSYRNIALHPSLLRIARSRTCCVDR